MKANYLTDLQLRALEPTVRLIEAGPGSGKTRAVVERYRRLAGQAGRFAALVSFTNSAIGEVRRRCAAQPHLLQPPNFVGTFDAFFHRFVTTPSFLRAGGRQPQYVASWDDLPEHWSRVRPPFGGPGIPLSAFEQDVDGTYRLVDKRLSRSDSLMWKNLAPYTRESLESQAGTRHASLARAGIMSADTARAYALHILESADGGRIVDLLCRRFSELIVDEFQDCNETEIGLLENFQARGLAVVAVSDPDQAIYEFRRSGSEDVYQNFRDSVPKAAIASLNECHRSTQAICDVISSLRHISHAPVHPSRNAPTGSPHIYVVAGRSSDVLAKANSVLQSHGISPQDSRILAHGTRDARRLYHQQPASKGSSSAKMILDAIFELRNAGVATATRRLAALNTLGRVFLSAIQRDDYTRRFSMKDDLAALGIEPATLRILSKRLVDASYTWEGPDSYATSLSAVINDGFAEFGLTPKARIRTLFPKPKPDLWVHWAAQIDGLFADHSLGWQWSNIHQVKGGEFDAVLLSVPAKAHNGSAHVFDDWENKANSEQRRVLYVGASRAQRLLMFWAEGHRHAQLLRILNRDGIPFLVV